MCFGELGDQRKDFLREDHPVIHSSNLPSPVSASLQNSKQVISMANREEDRPLEGKHFLVVAGILLEDPPPHGLA